MTKIPLKLEDEDNEWVTEQFEFAQKSFVCNLQDIAEIPSRLIQLDNSQSTVDVLSNDKILTNVCDAIRHLILNCNSTLSNMVSSVNILMESRTFCA